jgi:hypothetical protein
MQNGESRSREEEAEREIRPLKDKKVFIMCTELSKQTPDRV